MTCDLCGDTVRYLRATARADHLHFCASCRPRRWAHPDHRLRRLIRSKTAIGAFRGLLLRGSEQPA